MNFEIKNSKELKNFSNLFLMTSAVFFFFYLGLLVTIIMLVFGGVDRLSHFDDPAFPRGYDNTYNVYLGISLLLTTIPIISLIGSILLTRQLKKCGFHWKSAIPLVFSAGVIAISFTGYILSIYHVPVFEGYSFYGFLLCEIGLLILAASAALFFIGYNRAVGGITQMNVRIISIIGLLGIVELGLLFINPIAYEIAHPNVAISLEDLFWKSGSTWGLAGNILSAITLIYILILLPVIGYHFLVLGKRFGRSQ